MKKINRLTLVLTLMAVGLFAGCASDEEATRENQKIVLDGSHFKFTEVAYQADQAVTRAAASVKPATVDLGDGLEAEVSVTPDAPTGKTRAVDPISDGKYTILAFDPTTHDLQGKLEGSVTSGVFTPDAGQKLLLDPGTYDFTCFSEPVVYDEPNNRLAVKNWLTKSSTIGHVQATIAGDDYEVPFSMEHKAARVRLNITSDILSENTPIDAYLQGTTFLTGYWVQDWYTAYSGALNNTGNFWYNTPQPLTFTNIAPVTTQTGTTCTSAYGYMLPSTQPNNSLKDYTLHFTAGTIGGAPLASKTINLSGATFPTGFQWTTNQSITINVNVKGQLYLFEDGKARVLVGKGTHTPIGVVLQQKWEPTNQKGIAIALKDVSNVTVAYTTPYNAAKMNTQHNTTHYTDANDAVNDMEGYKWTYETAGSVDGRIKANFEGDYTPFYKTARYTPGVTITGANVGKWYVPAFGEWALAWKVLGKWDGNIPSTPGVPLTMSVSTMNNAFTAAGGSAFQNYDYWCSTEYANEMRPTLSAGGAGFYIGLNATHNLDSYVRPFVHF